MSDSVTDRLYRRLLMVFGRALVKVVNDAGGLQQLQIQLGKDELRDNTPRFAEYGFTSSPLSGARAIAIFMGGDRSNGAVIATDDPRHRPTGIAAGEVVIYDDQGQKIHITRAGIVISGANKQITIENCPKVQVNGGDVVADTISLKTHVHSGVQAGPSNTGAPVP
jgi:phage baseplate assembly protein V